MSAPDPAGSTPSPEGAPKGASRRRVPPQLIFGIVAATAEMAVILWFMYC